jgi:hypothetical protein
MLADNYSKPGSSKQLETEMAPKTKDLIVENHIKMIPVETPKLPGDKQVELQNEPRKIEDLLETESNRKESGKEADWVNFKKGESKDELGKISIKKKLFTFMESKIDGFLFNIDDRIGKIQS